jgi:hypothetical protein
MRDFFQVLRQKEADIERVRREINALRSVLPLLADDADGIEYDTDVPLSESEFRETGTESARRR